MTHRIRQLRMLADELTDGRIDRASFDLEKARLLHAVSEDGMEQMADTSEHPIGSTEPEHGPDIPGHAAFVSHMQGTESSPPAPPMEGSKPEEASKFRLAFNGINTLVTMMILVFAIQLVFGLLYYQRAEPGPLLEQEEPTITEPGIDTPEASLDDLRQREQLTSDIRRLFRILIRTDRVEWAEEHFAAVLRGLGYKVRVDEAPGTTYRIRWGEVPDPIIEEIFELSSDTLSVDIESFDQWAEDDTLDREIRIEIPPEFEP